MMNLDHNKKYVLACSFGPDSMALFAMLYKGNYNFVVAHVNYHKRDVSNFEEESLRKYCLDHNVEIRVLSADHAPEKVNFQEWARELRYAFFKKVSDEFNADAVLVAHQEDDLIETYLMQKQRGSYVNFYGIKECVDIMNCHIIRPLLNYSKKDLLNFDIENNIPYSIDCSNLTNDYSRNMIRHEVVEKLSKEERQKLRFEIDDLNAKKEKFSLDEYLEDVCLKIPTIINLPFETFRKCIYAYLDYVSLSSNISSSFLSELQKALQSNKQNIVLKISTLEFVIEYGYLFVRQQKATHKYNYVVPGPGTYLYPEFSIELLVDSSDRNINSNDYPLTIRNASSGDTVIINNYICKINRLFIDWKMPKSLRSTWPVIVNKDNKIIYVPRYRKEFIDNHKTKFVININYLRMK